MKLLLASLLSLLSLHAIAQRQAITEANLAAADTTGEIELLDWAQLTEAQAATLSNAVISQFSPASFALIPATRFSNLTPDSIIGVTDPQLNQLNQDQIRGIGAKVNRIRPATLMAMDNTKFQMLEDAQLGALEMAQIQALSIAPLEKIRGLGQRIQQLSLAQLGQLDDSAKRVLRDAANPALPFSAEQRNMLRDGVQTPPVVSSDAPGTPDEGATTSGTRYVASTCTFVNEIPLRIVTANVPGCGRPSNVRTCVAYVSCATTSAADSPRFIRMSSCRASFCQGSTANAASCTSDRTRYSREADGSNDDEGVTAPVKANLTPRATGT